MAQIQCIFPVDGRVYVARLQATGDDIQTALSGATSAQRPWRKTPLAVRWMLDLRHQIGIPHTLDALIPDADRLGEIGEMAVCDPSTATNPIQHGATEYAEIARRAFYGEL